MTPVLKPVLKYLQHNLQGCFTNWLVLTFFSVSKSQALFWLEPRSLKLLGKITGCRGGQQGAGYERPSQKPVSPLAWSAQPAEETDLSRTASALYTGAVECTCLQTYTSTRHTLTDTPNTHQRKKGSK